MTAPRLASHMLVGRLLRLAQAQGGFAAVLRKGDETSGVILLQLVEKGVEKGLYERMIDPSGAAKLLPAGEAYWNDKAALSQYIERRERMDRDMWIVELDIANAEQFVAGLCD